ncbi:MAG: hypothetical protein IJ584_14815 [Bacteroidales bacterium]|nr:hypothetical protein [Bacteroidales bacterium]
MIHRPLNIGRWLVDFLFAVDGYDIEEALGYLYDIDTSYHIMRKAYRLMKRGKRNTGFTVTNDALRHAVIVIGPTTSGHEFQNTLIHEIHHLAVAVAESLGVDLEGETPAYVSGDTAMELVDVICEFGCDKCNHGHL